MSKVACDRSDGLKSSEGESRRKRRCQEPRGKSLSLSFSEDVRSHEVRVARQISGLATHGKQGTRRCVGRKKIVQVAVKIGIPEEIEVHVTVLSCKVTNETSNPSTLPRWPLTRAYVHSTERQAMNTLIFRVYKDKNINTSHNSARMAESGGRARPRESGRRRGI